ncbi:hypothetical protein BKA93DRAFT_345923 [Sparassis latifolia]
MTSPTDNSYQVGSIDANRLTERYPARARDDRMSYGAGPSHPVAQSFFEAGWPAGSRDEDSLALAGPAKPISDIDPLGDLLSDMPIAQAYNAPQTSSSSFYSDRHPTGLPSHISVGQRVEQCAPFTPSNDIFNAYSGPNDTGVPGVEYDIFHGENYVCPPDYPCRSPALGIYQDPGIDVPTVPAATLPPQMTIAHAQAQRVLSPVVSTAPSMTSRGRPPFGRQFRPVHSRLHDHRLTGPYPVPSTSRTLTEQPELAVPASDPAALLPFRTRCFWGGL